MNFYAEREKLRERYKKFILDFMISNANCSPFADGLKQAEIFRECGMDWVPRRIAHLNSNNTGLYQF